MLRELTTAEQLYVIAAKHTYYSDLFNVTADILSNILIISVLSSIRIFQNNQCTFYLKVESAINIGLILTISPLGILSYQLGSDLTYISLAWCKLKLTPGQIFGMCSVYTICGDTFDQNLSTYHRYSFQQMSTFKSPHRFICFTISLISLHSLLFLIFTEINSTFGCTVYNSILKKYFSYFYCPILSSGLPIVTISVFSLSAFRNVRSLVRRRRDRQMTAVILARVICLIVLGFRI